MTALAPGAAARHDGHTVPILMYHSIATTSNPRFRRFAVEPRLLREHLDVLAEQGWTTLTMSGYLAARATPTALSGKVAVLTFDDAFADFCTEALPLLGERGMNATLFIPAGCVAATSRWMAFEHETSRPLLDWDRLRDVAAAGIECGSHSYSHPELDRVPPWRLAAELRRSRQILEHELQREVRAFAYPYGYHTARIRDEVTLAGYRCACIVGDAPASAADDPMALPRLTVPGGTTRDQFADLLAKRRSEVHMQRIRVKAALWRMARRCGLEQAVLQRANR